MLIKMIKKYNKKIKLIEINLKINKKIKIVLKKN